MTYLIRVTDATGRDTWVNTAFIAMVRPAPNNENGVNTEILLSGIDCCGSWTDSAVVRCATSVDEVLIRMTGKRHTVVLNER